MGKVSRFERDRSTVAQYKYLRELKDCLNSGWPAGATREYLIERYGKDAPGERAIERWRKKHLPEAAIVPHRIISEKLKGVQYKVDMIGHLGRLIVMLEDRIGRALEREGELGGYLLSATDQAVQVYLSALRDWMDVAQDLGVVKAPPMPQFDMRTQVLNITPETIKALKETVIEIKKLEIQEKGGKL